MPPSRTVRARAFVRTLDVVPRRLALALVLLATSCGGLGPHAYVIPGESMEPSIHKGDSIGCSTKVPDRLPRGAVVVFDGTGTNFAPVGATAGKFTERVVGLPGETIAGGKDGVTIDGRPLPEPYAVGEEFPFDPVHVPADQYFLMGDNRDHSSDSRFNGPVPRDAVIATCTRIVRPRKHRGRIPGT